MDIAKIKGNSAFYEGFEGEPQITLAVKSDEDIHIRLWDGYFADIFGEPHGGRDWYGFTRDYQQLKGAFSADADCAEISPAEYLEDLRAYSSKAFRYKETAQVFELICELLQYAVESGKKVLVTTD